MNAKSVYVYEATPTESPVGDIVTIRLAVIHPSDTTVTTDALVWTDDFLVYESTVGSQPSGNKSITQWVYRVAVFSPGTHKTPAITLIQTGSNGKVSYLIPAVSFFATSLLPSDATLAALKPLLDMVFMQWAWLFGGLFLALGAGFYFWKKPRVIRQMLSPEPVVGTPKARALATLAALVASGDIERGQYKHVCLALTDLLKQTLYLQYGIRCHELTSDELLQLPLLQSFSPVLYAHIRLFLSEADQIKFANQLATKDTCYALIGTLKEIISELPEPSLP